MSSPRYRDAASRAHGHGTINVALVATPSRSASYTPTLAAWHDPRPSQFRMTSRASAAYPSVSASSVTPPKLLAVGPQSAAGGAGVVGGARDLDFVGEVRLERIRAGEALAHEHQVDEQAVAGPVHVGQQPPVLIPRLDVADESHRGARPRQVVRPLRRFRPLAPHRLG